MNDYDEIEQQAIEKTRNKKPKMKVSGKSVFVLERKAGEPEESIKEKKTPR